MLFKQLCTLLLISSLTLAGCADTDSPAEDKVPNDSTRTQPETWGEPYTNARYDVALNTPDEWILMEERNMKPAMGTFAINLFKRGTKAANDVPLHVHAKAQHSYVAVWPHGIGTELPSGERSSFGSVENAPTLQFDVDEEASKVLTLKNGKPWAYFIRPAQLPEKWEEHGFIFAQIRTTNNSATCYSNETGEKIALKKCDPLAGDRYVRQADRDEEDAATIRRILEQLSLQNIKEETETSDLIQVEKPLPNMDVTSPLTVKGKARGPWFNEGSFLVELYDANDNKLAEEQAQAEGKWMTDDFVPFSVTLQYDAPDDQRGELVFHKANPSGLPENARTYSIPVLFPPK